MGRGGRDDSFEFGRFPFGFAGLGGSGSLMSSFFGGNDPFDDPFFTRPFQSMMSPSFFGSGESIFGAANHATHGGFLEHQNPSPKVSRGPVIKELNSDDEEEEEYEGANLEKKVNSRKHLRSDNDPYVQEPDEDGEEGKNEHMQISNDLSLPNAKRQQNSSFFFQSSTVSYGGPSGAYCTSSTTKRAASDGVILEERKEADSTTGKATHRISKGMHGKGHSVTRKLSSRGKVHTLQTLHNLNKDELPNFEETWNGKAKQYFSEWNPTLVNGNMRIDGSERWGMQPPERLRLPSISQAQPQPHVRPQAPQAIDANGGHGLPSRRMPATPPGQPHMQATGRGKSQAGVNSYDRRFN